MLVRLGCVVLEASNGEEGLAVATAYKGSIDTILTDLMMPGMTGREFAEHVVTMRPNVRILFTSGYTDDEVLRRRLVEEGQPFLQKPFTSQQLLRAILAK